MVMRLRKIARNSAGFSLVELAVVMTVAGILVGAAAGLLKPYYDDYRYSATKQRLEKIADALAFYAQKYYRLPCPANANPTVEPFGAPMGSGSSGTGTDAACPALAGEGLVPFLALGIGEDQAKDAYGNFITYKVTQAFAGTPSATEVYEACRTPQWIKGGVNANPAKARFCCARVLKDGGTTVILGSAPFSGDAARTIVIHQASNLADVNVPAASGTVPEPGITSMAFMLVSHGPNGNWASLKGGGQRPVIGGVGNEKNNRVGGSMINNVLYEYTASGFDDIILWRTNTQLMSAFGNNSCARP